jgi:hypothetical protein
MALVTAGEPLVEWPGAIFGKPLIIEGLEMGILRRTRPRRAEIQRSSLQAQPERSESSPCGFVERPTSAACRRCAPRVNKAPGQIELTTLAGAGQRYIPLFQELEAPEIVFIPAGLFFDHALQRLASNTLR